MGPDEPITLSDLVATLTTLLQEHDADTPVRVVLATAPLDAGMPPTFTIHDLGEPYSSEEATEVLINISEGERI